MENSTEPNTLGVDSNSTPDTDGPTRPAERPAASRSKRTPQDTPEAATGPTVDAEEASEAHTNPADNKTARQKIAALLWWSVPSSTNEQAKERTEELLDAYRAEVITKAVGRLRAVPVTCTALTGPVWYGDGWNDAIRVFEDIADYQKPDDEAYPGELQRLRMLYLQLRVAALRKEDLAEAQRLLVIHAEHEAKEREKSTAASGDAVPAFFEPGRTYAREHHAATIRFAVDHISEPPDGSYRVAFGWRTEDGDTTWSPFDSDDFEGWTDVTAAGEVST